MCNRYDIAEFGIANGTTSTFVRAQLKADAKLQPIPMHEHWWGWGYVNAVSVNNVEYLELEWQDSSQFKGKILGAFGIRTVQGEISNNRISFRLLLITQRPVTNFKAKRWTPS
jgi:hypothetical protein